ncbi:MAG: hypothetical protein GY753_04535 [Gammaproteobacteria bacterium]|nr:hypothetical protein [Gammaproteobacteria bacterium]
MQEAEHGITDLAMNNSRFHGDETLLVKFYKHPKENSAKSTEAGRPIFEEVPYIQIMTPGNKDSIVIRPATQMDKQRFAEHYRKFEAREDQEGIEGTLLEEWAGISRSQCEELKYLNIRTVEQLVAVSDANAQNVMGINFLKQKATKYLEDTKGDATAAALADMQAKYDALVAQMSGTPVTDAVEEPEEEKAPRKRRTKAEMEAAKAAE